MVNYINLQATAKRLIEANGVNALLIKSSDNLDASDEPWRGSRVGNVKSTATGLTIKGVFLDDDERNQAGTVIREGKKVFLTHGDTTENLKEFDTLIYAGENWNIDAVQITEPGAVKMLYKLEISQ